MPWVESASPHFRARHDAAQAAGAERVLDSLERTRAELESSFQRIPAAVTVILHRSMLSLAAAQPLTPAAWLITDPAARRYVAGFTIAGELHVLEPGVLAARASSVPGSREMLELTAASLYARRVILENNHDLPRRLNPARLFAELRWAWLLEGGARWFAGQTEHARPAIARRLREGGAPSFPPSLRDALLLGSTVIDLLAREEGELAAAQFTCRLHPQGARGALAKAFPGRPLTESAHRWHAHLARLASS